MKVVRRASLVFSLVLIVAIAVGYVVRTAELSGARDRALSMAADLGSAELSSLIESAQVAAGSGVDPDAAATALASVNAGTGVCAVSDDNVACDGDGPRPAADVVADVESARANSAFDAAPAEVTVYEAQMTIRVDGPQLSVLVQAPVDVVDSSGDGVTVWATTFLPSGTSVGGFVVDGDIRQTATTVAAAPSAFVVAATQDSVALPGEEERFYLIVFTLAVVLLVLAGVTLFVEQRNLVERASFDTLTKLPNRGEFERRSAELLLNAERHGTGVCLLMFDLNGFKKVNDTYGHNAGDEMLKIVGSRLRKAVRDDDVVARWGGDEFVVVMPGIDNEEMGGRRARQLAEQISGRTRLEGIADPLRVKVSVGVAIWPGHGGDIESLVTAADQAMYQAKRDGLVCWIAKPAEPDKATPTFV